MARGRRGDGHAGVGIKLKFNTVLSVTSNRDFGLVSVFHGGHHYCACRRADDIEPATIARCRGFHAAGVSDRDQHISDLWLARAGVICL